MPTGLFETLGDETRPTPALRWHSPGLAKIVGEEEQFQRTCRNPGQRCRDPKPFVGVHFAPPCATVCHTECTPSRGPNRPSWAPSRQGPFSFGEFRAHSCAGSRSS